MIFESNQGSAFDQYNTGWAVNGPIFFGNACYGAAASNACRNPRQMRLDQAKQWLKDNGGAHPGCLVRFTRARGA